MEKHERNRSSLKPVQKRESYFLAIQNRVSFLFLKDANLLTENITERIQILSKVRFYIYVEFLMALSTLERIPKFSHL